ncbi:MAG: hypothetical protein HYZ37_09385 [Candidatus Solibacter usitatus]|nr:hypothetical protein [Candidatus Solibacter usitatus]
MSIYEKYDLMEVLRDDGVKSFQALEKDTGRAVELHLLAGQPGVTEPPYELLEMIRTLTPDGAALFLEAGEHLGTPFVITHPLIGFAGFRHWVAQNQLVLPPTFDRFARVGQWKVPAAIAEPRPATTEAAVPKADGPGEFTRLFKTPEPQQSVASSTSDSGPGDVTRVFAVTPAPQTPSEATRLFAAPAPNAHIPEPQGPGEFTRMFATPSAPPAAPPVQKPQEPGEFTRMFATPSTPPAAPAVQKPQEPGEFTRMFATPSTPPGPAPAAQVKAPAQSKWPLYAMGGVILLLVIALVVVLLRV